MSLFIKGVLIIETEMGVQINSRMVELLKFIEKTGSLNTAVKELGMSYSYAWNLLFKLNCQLPQPLVILQRGGKGGGVASLTDQGRNFIKQYEKLKKDFHEFLKEHPMQL